MQYLHYEYILLVYNNTQEFRISAISDSVFLGFICPFIVTTTPVLQRCKYKPLGFFLQGWSELIVSPWQYGLL